MRPVGFFPLLGGVPFLPLHVPVPDCRRTKGEYSVELLGRVGQRVGSFIMGGLSSISPPFTICYVGDDDIGVVGDGAVNTAAFCCGRHTERCSGKGNDG